eukprot:GILJ01011049.1.p1 GENE.GILJ01011049.1~~GILJ01011049.1.p1  ORF type:complete len:1987 (+),score=454.09 GILJ01011049.1:191-6151(+)
MSFGNMLTRVLNSYTQLSERCRRMDRQSSSDQESIHQLATTKADLEANIAQLQQERERNQESIQNYDQLCKRLEDKLKQFTAGNRALDQDLNQTLNERDDALEALNVVSKWADVLFHFCNGRSLALSSDSLYMSNSSALKVTRFEGFFSNDSAVTDWIHGLHKPLADVQRLAGVLAADSVASNVKKILSQFHSYMTPLLTHLFRIELFYQSNESTIELDPSPSSTTVVALVNQSTLDSTHQNQRELTEKLNQALLSLRDAEEKIWNNEVDNTNRNRRQAMVWNHILDSLDKWHAQAFDSFSSEFSTLNINRYRPRNSSVNAQISNPNLRRIDSIEEHPAEEEQDQFSLNHMYESTQAIQSPFLNDLESTDGIQFWSSNRVLARISSELIQAYSSVLPSAVSADTGDHLPLRVVLRLLRFAFESTHESTRTRIKSGQYESALSGLRAQISKDSESTVDGLPTVLGSVREDLQTALTEISDLQKEMWFFYATTSTTIQSHKTTEQENNILISALSKEVESLLAVIETYLYDQYHQSQLEKGTFTLTHMRDSERYNQLETRFRERSETCQMMAEDHRSSVNQLSVIQLQNFRDIAVLQREKHRWLANAQELSGELSLLAKEHDLLSQASSYVNQFNQTVQSVASGLGSSTDAIQLDSNVHLVSIAEPLQELRRQLQSVLHMAPQAERIASAGYLPNFTSLRGRDEMVPHQAVWSLFYAVESLIGLVKMKEDALFARVEDLKIVTDQVVTARQQLRDLENRIGTRLMETDAQYEQTLNRERQFRAELTQELSFVQAELNRARDELIQSSKILTEAKQQEITTNQKIANVKEEYGAALEALESLHATVVKQLQELKEKTDRINALNSELSKLKQDLESTQSELSKRTARVNQLTEEKDKQANTLMELQRGMDEKDRVISRLTMRLETEPATRAQQIEELWDKNDKLEKDVLNKIEQIRRIESEKNQLIRDREKDRENINESVEHLKKLREEKNVMMLRIKVAEAKREELTQQVNHYKDQITDLESQLKLRRQAALTHEEKDTEIDDLKRKLSVLERSKAKDGDKVKTLTFRIEEQDREVADLTRRVLDSDKTVSRLTEKVSTLESHKTLLQRELDDAKGDNSSTAIPVLRREKSELYERVKVAESDRESLQSRIRDMESRINQMERDLSKKTERIRALERDKETVVHESETAQRSLTEQQSKWNLARKEKQSLADVVKKLQEEKETLERKLLESQGNESHLNQLHPREAEELKSNLRVMEKELKAHRARVVTAEQKHETVLKQLEEVKTALTDCQLELQRAQTERDELLNQLESTKRNRSSGDLTNRRTSELESKIAELETELRYVKAEKDNLNVELNRVRKSVQQDGSPRKSIANQESETDTRLRTALNQRDELKQQLLTNENAMKQSQSRVAELESQIKEKRKQLDDLRAELRTLKSQGGVAGGGNDVDKAKIKELETELAFKNLELDRIKHDNGESAKLAAAREELRMSQEKLVEIEQWQADQIDALNELNQIENIWDDMQHLKQWLEAIGLKLWTATELTSAYAAGGQSGRESSRDRSASFDLSIDGGALMNKEMIQTVTQFVTDHIRVLRNELKVSHQPSLQNEFIDESGQVANLRFYLLAVCSSFIRGIEFLNMQLDSQAKIYQSRIAEMEEIANKTVRSISSSSLSAVYDALSAKSQQPAKLFDVIRVANEQADSLIQQVESSFAQSIKAPRLSLTLQTNDKLITDVNNRCNSLRNALWTGLKSAVNQQRTSHLILLSVLYFPEYKDLQRQFSSTPNKLKTAGYTEMPKRLAVIAVTMVASDIDRESCLPVLDFFGKAHDIVDPLEAVSNATDNLRTVWTELNRLNLSYLYVKMLREDVQAVLNRVGDPRQSAEQMTRSDDIIDAVTEKIGTLRNGDLVSLQNQVTAEATAKSAQAILEAARTEIKAPETASSLVNTVRLTLCEVLNDSLNVYSRVNKIARQIQSPSVDLSQKERQLMEKKQTR